MAIRQSDALDEAFCQEVVQNERSKASASHFIVKLRGFEVIERIFQVGLENCFPGYDGVIGEAEVNVFDTYRVGVGVDIGMYTTTLFCTQSTENVNVSNSNALWKTGL